MCHHKATPQITHAPMILPAVFNDQQKQQVLNVSIFHSTFTRQKVLRKTEFCSPKTLSAMRGEKSLCIDSWNPDGFSLNK